MTTIRIKIPAGAYRVILTITELLSKQIKVYDPATLITQECLDSILVKLNKRKYSKQDNLYMSLSLIEMVVFINKVGDAMFEAGEYEKAIMRDVKENLYIQVNREIQIRMFN